MVSSHAIMEKAITEPHASGALVEDLLPALGEALSPQRFAALTELISLPSMSVPLENPISFYDELNPKQYGDDVLVQLLQFLESTIHPSTSNPGWHREIYGALRKSDIAMGGFKLYSQGSRIILGGLEEDISLEHLLSNMRADRGLEREIRFAALSKKGSSGHMKPSQRLREGERAIKALRSLRRYMEEFRGGSTRVPRWLVVDDRSGEWDENVIGDFYISELRQTMYCSLLPEDWMDGGVVRNSFSEDAWKLRGEIINSLTSRSGRLKRSYGVKGGGVLVRAILPHRGALTGADVALVILLALEYNDEWAAAMIA